MPRVAHVISTPSGVGGAEQIVASLVAEAARRGWEATVVNPFAREPGDSDLAAICAPAQYLGYPCRSWAQVPALRNWLAATLHHLHPEVVHSHLFHAGVAVASLRGGCGHASLHTHHHGDHLAHAGRRYQVALDRWAGRRHDRVVAISEYVREYLVCSYRYRPSHVALIRNGWDGRPLTHRGGGQEPTIVCVANFRRQKGHSDLLAAFSILREELPSARLVLVGEGPLEGALRRQVEDRGIGSAVFFRGRVQEVWEELANADVFALASRYEPLGLAVMEAMAAELPIVATSVGGIPELVTSEIGRLVAPGDPAALALAMGAVLRDQNAARRMGELARGRAETMRVNVMVREYFELYETVCG